MSDGNPQSDRPSQEAPNLDAGPTGYHPTPGPDDAPPTEGAGARIGSYKLLQKLGEGGMGAVFLAEQTEPVRRQVALKVIKAGMDSRHVLARFEAERQALALMDHPNIARVLDAGATDRGGPFFVMELVKGIPITRYCDQERLSPKERLALFIPVCQAVQHAHQKGIIHRDIKPSNVLIALYDGRPVPKVIDFGLAKATQQKLTERTLFTEIGAMVGTLEYMAPEQAELNNLDIDTRVDVYALGVLLYELLTGTPPFTRQQLRNAEFMEMLRMIREVEPPRPSTRLSSSTDLPATAARRKLEPKKLAQFIRGDLDWIVMKCLDKERSRRYETANGLGMDVQRFLADEPVLARPPSAGYRLRKFVRRNRGSVLAAAVILLALVAGVVGTTIGLAQARRAEAEARQQALKAEKAAAAERKANELLQSLFAGLDPRVMRMGVPDIHGQLIAQLDEAAAQLQRDSLEPLTQARLQHALGQAFFGMGERKKSVALLENSLRTREATLGDKDPDTLQGMMDLGDAYGGTGQFGKAMALRERAASKRAEVLGDDHPDTLRTMSRLADGYRSVGKLSRAVAILERVLDKQKELLTSNHADTLATMGILGETYQGLGKNKKFLALQQEAFDRQKDILGPTHLQTLESKRRLAAALRANGQHQRGLELFEKVLEEQMLNLGKDHPNTLFTMTSLGRTYSTDGQHARGIEMLESCLEKQKVKLDPDHRDTLRCMYHLALAYRAADQLEKGLALLEMNFKKRAAVLGENHTDTLNTMHMQAMAYRKDGQPEKGLDLLEKTLERRKAALTLDHPATLFTMHSLAVVYRAESKLDKAVDLFEQALAGRTKVLGAEHPETLSTHNNLIGACEAQGDHAKVETLWVRMVDVRTMQHGADDPAVADALAALGRNRLKQKKHAEAEAALQAALRIRKSRQPDDWNTFNTSSLLGAALLGQEQYDAAEPMLLAGYEGLKQRQAQIPPNQKARVTDAGQRLVQLYNAWRKADQADRWRKELEVIKVTQ